MYQTVRSTRITPDQMQEISEAFSLFDSDKDNQLNPSEFEAALLVLGIDIKRKDYGDILKGFNLELAEKISFKDFFGIAKFCLESKGPFTRSVRAFKSFDEEYSGKITFQELRKVTR
ncbi:unnamed protein product [Rodentolepis nana]|uniref:EF-hand domain-containing protein n=1 Tax=Rodentolepis nana TaxID=102285 RepID=A0A0R3TMJ6_RODNA|nr:unnamed protein product [Rodentolepis nana]